MVLVVAVLALILSSAGIVMTYSAMQLTGELSSLRDEVSSLKGVAYDLAELTGYKDLIERSELIAGAKEEGELVIYHMMEETAFNAIVEEFTKKYPFIKVLGWRGMEGPVCERIRSEIRAGKLEASIMCGLGTLEIREEFKEKGWLMPYKSPELKYFEERWYDPDGYWVTTELLVQVVGWNTKYVTKDITRLTDVLDPAFKGKVSSANPWLTGGSILLWCYGVNRELGLDYFEGLREQDIKLYIGHGAQKADLGTGDIWISVGNLLHHMVSLRETGVPIEFCFPEDGSSFAGQYAFIFKDGPSPNAAKLWIDFMLSYGEQKGVTERWRWSPRKGIVSIHPEMPPLEEINVWEIDATDYLATIADLIEELKVIYK